MNKKKIQPKKYNRIDSKHGGNLSDKVDRELLHQFLWKYRDRSGFISFKSNELAGMLGISVYAMSTMLTEMCKKGYLRKLGSGKYFIIEPKIAAWVSDGDDQQES